MVCLCWRTILSPFVKKLWAKGEKLGTRKEPLRTVSSLSPATHVPNPSPFGLSRFTTMFTRTTKIKIKYDTKTQKDACNKQTNGLTDSVNSKGRCNYLSEQTRLLRLSLRLVLTRGQKEEHVTEQDTSAILMSNSNKFKKWGDLYHVGYGLFWRNAQFRPGRRRMQKKGKIIGKLEQVQRSHN